MTINPFDYVNAINFSKKDLYKENGGEGYIPFIVNRMFSFYPDGISSANEMNRLGHLSPKLQFYYYLNKISPKKRFARWVKKTDNADLDIVKTYYGFNNEKAMIALTILTKDQLNEIKNKISEVANEHS